MDAMASSALFSPLKIGSLEIANRVAMGPMALMDAHPPGFASDQTRAMYAARAAGGVGLIITGGTVATRWAWEAAPFANVLRLDTDETIASLSEVAEAVHQFGTKIFAQLMQGYGRGGSSRTRGVRSAAASSVPLILENGLGLHGNTNRFVGETPRELALEEIEQIEHAVGEAAERAKRAGFDGVEIPCFIGYLGASFFSPILNKRTDKYGGTFENRIRFIVNNVRRVKTGAGPDYPVGVRLTCDDYVEGGIRIEEALRFAKILEHEGVHYISLFIGGYEALDVANSTRDGTMIDRGFPQAFKEHLKIPIMVPGLHNPVRAAKAISDGHADIVSVTRPLLADANWARKAKEGQFEAITKCDRENACVGRLFNGLPVRCTQNSNLGRERHNLPPKFPI